MILSKDFQMIDITTEEPIIIDITEEEDSKRERAKQILDDLIAKLDRLNYIKRNQPGTYDHVHYKKTDNQ